MRHFGDNIYQSGAYSIGKVVGNVNQPAPQKEPERPARTSPLVFVNYRGTDEKAATYLDNELTRRLGQGAVFRDARMPVGTEYPPELLERARTCPVMISIIGERWENTFGLRLLNDPGDWVRREIAIALKHGVYVAPVLVGARARPVPEQLPEDIRAIAYRQARQLRSRYDENDVRQLVDELQQDIPTLRT